MPLDVTLDLPCGQEACLLQDVETAGARVIIPDDEAAAGDVASYKLDHMLQQSSQEVILRIDFAMLVSTNPR